jgi:hypothetical protein
MLYNQATDLVTRQTVWVGTQVENLPTWTGTEWATNGKGQSLGSDFDGLSAVSLADLATDFQGWVGPGHRYWCNPEAKRLSFTARSFPA